MFWTPRATSYRATRLRDGSSLSVRRLVPGRSHKLRKSLCKLGPTDADDRWAARAQADCYPNVRASISVVARSLRHSATAVAKLQNQRIESVAQADSAWCPQQNFRTASRVRESAPRVTNHQRRCGASPVRADVLHPQRARDWRETVVHVPDRKVAVLLPAAGAFR